MLRGVGIDKNHFSISLTNGGEFGHSCDHFVKACTEKMQDSAALEPYFIQENILFKFLMQAFKKANPYINSSATRMSAPSMSSSR